MKPTVVGGDEGAAGMGAGAAGVTVNEEGTVVGTTTKATLSLLCLAWRASTRAALPANKWQSAALGADAKEARITTEYMAQSFR